MTRTVSMEVDDDVFPGMNKSHEGLAGEMRANMHSHPPRFSSVFDVRYVAHLSAFRLADHSS